MRAIIMTMPNSLSGRSPAIAPDCWLLVGALMAFMVFGTATTAWAQGQPDPEPAAAQASPTPEPLPPPPAHSVAHFEAWLDAPSADDSPRNPEQLLVALRRLDRWPQALAEARALAARQPEAPRWLAWEALCLLRAGHVRSAIDALQHSATLMEESGSDPLDDPIHALATGMVLLWGGAPERSVARFSRAGIEAPLMPEAVLWLAEAQRVRADRMQEAYYRSNILKVPSDAWPAPMLQSAALVAEVGDRRTQDRPPHSARWPEGFEYRRLPLAWAEVSVSGAAPPPAPALRVPPGAAQPMLLPVAGSPAAYLRLLRARLSRPDLRPARVPALPVRFTPDGPPVLLLLDTLAPAELLLHPWAAAEARWQAPGAPTANTANASGMLVELHLDGVSLSRVQARVVELPISTPGDTPRVAGVVGPGFFAPNSMMIDLARHDLLIEAGHLFYDAEIEAPMLRLHGVALMAAALDAADALPWSDVLAGVDSLVAAPHIPPSLAGAWGGGSSLSGALPTRHVLLAGGPPLPVAGVQPAAWLDGDGGLAPTSRIGLMLDLATLAQLHATVTFEFSEGVVVFLPKAALAAGD